MESHLLGNDPAGQPAVTPHDFIYHVANSLVPQIIIITVLLCTCPTSFWVLSSPVRELISIIFCFSRLSHSH